MTRTTVQTEYLVRAPDGTDYDHGPNYQHCRRQAISLGPGATVHPLAGPTGLAVRTRPDGQDQVLFIALIDEPTQVG